MRKIFLCGDGLIQKNLYATAKKDNKNIFKDNYYYCKGYGGILKIQEIIDKLNSPKGETMDVKCAPNLMIAHCKLTDTTPNEKTFTNKIFKIKGGTNFENLSADVFSKDPIEDSEENICIIDDLGISFINNKDDFENSNLYPVLKNEKIYKIFKVSYENYDLIKKIVECNFKNVLFVFKMSNFRKIGLSMSLKLSYEQTLEDFLTYYKKDPVLRKIDNFIVYLTASGAIYKNKKDFSLIYYPNEIEGYFGKGEYVVRELREVGMAVMVYRMLEENRLTINIEDIQASLEGYRIAYNVGYPLSCLGKNTSEELKAHTNAYYDNLIKKLKNINLKNSNVFPCEFFNENSQEPVKLNGIINYMVNSEKALETAEKIVTLGVDKALEGIPVFRCGNLLIADREEIERYRSIKILLEKYIKDSKDCKPLSIAVFGPSGAGKSFAIKEIVKDINKSSKTKIETISANISQFNSIDDLNLKLQEVRDLIIKGSCPLIFFDEFDCSKNGVKLGWLKHFLAPMQDANFEEHSRIRLLSKSIFIFAGSNYETYDKFSCADKDDPTISKDTKLVDFCSRLRGVLDIEGLKISSSDYLKTYIRKAILIRSVLERQVYNDKKRFISDDGSCSIEERVLIALLKADFKNNARSLEFLITMCNFENRVRFVSSMLPNDEQLKLTINKVDEFLKNLQIN